LARTFLIPYPFFNIPGHIIGAEPANSLVTPDLRRSSRAEITDWYDRDGVRHAVPILGQRRITWNVPLRLSGKCIRITNFLGFDKPRNLRQSLVPRPPDLHLSMNPPPDNTDQHHQPKQDWDRNCRFLALRP